MLHTTLAGVEFGISQLKSMGIVFAFEAARNVADHFAGLI